jgi:hypothetical protein
MNINILKIKPLGFILSLGFIVLSNSCQDVIQVNLNNAAPQTVIEGSISNLPDTVRVLLSKTTDYFNPQSITPITNAQVSISDNMGNVSQPIASLNGAYYFGNLGGTPGTTYTLKVQSNNVTYSASSQMPAVVPIDSLAIVQSTDGDKENVLNCYIRDPAGLKNYYRMRIFRNKVLLTDSITKTEPIILFSDKYFDGRSTPLRVPSRRVGIKYYLPTDTIKVQLMSIDQQTYNFFRELGDITNTGRFVTSTSTPDNPDNNISNNGLGYFAAWSISEKEIIVK